MKKITLIIVAIMLLGGCASNNLYKKNISVLSSNYSDLLHSRKYCKNHSSDTDYDVCMDMQYHCAVEVGTIVNYLKSKGAKEKDIEYVFRKTMRKQGIYERWRTSDCGYCEWLETLKKTVNEFVEKKAPIKK